jgi:hypothetical protein
VKSAPVLKLPVARQPALEPGCYANLTTMKLAKATGSDAEA